MHISNRRCIVATSNRVLIEAHLWNGCWDSNAEVAALQPETAPSKEQLAEDSNVSGGREKRSSRKRKAMPGDQPLTPLSEELSVGPARARIANATAAGVGSSSKSGAKDRATRLPPGRAAQAERKANTPDPRSEPRSKRLKIRLGFSADTGVEASPLEVSLFNNE